MEKKSKISFEILQLPKYLGGAGLIDLEAKCKAMQLQWVKKIKDLPEIKEVAYQILDNPMGI